MIGFLLTLKLTLIVSIVFSFVIKMEDSDRGILIMAMVALHVVVLLVRVGAYFAFPAGGAI